MSTGTPENTEKLGDQAFRATELKGREHEMTYAAH